MSSPFLGQILLVGFNFVPVDYAFCDGALLPISEFSGLFQLIGTTYGGDGQSTFALPDLRGRVPIHMGTSTTGATYVEGQLGGVETVTLNANQLPSHNHPLRCSANSQNSADAGGSVLAATAGDQYSTNAPTVPMGAMIGVDGGNQPHDNMQPFLTLNWIIAVNGVYPTT